MNAEAANLSADRPALHDHDTASQWPVQDHEAERTCLPALVPTTAAHGVTCGQRVPSPHDECQARYAPYLAGERTVRRWGEVVVLCVACGAAWREVAA